MRLTNLDILYWAAGFIGHLILLLVLIIRGRTRSFPMFTSLIVLNVVRTIILFGITHLGTHRHYFYTYWSLAIVDVILQFAVIYEIASSIFRPRGDWATDIRKSIFWWTLFSVFIASFLTWIPEPASRFWVQVVFLKGSFFTAVLECECFAGMIALSWVAGLNWTSHSVRIAQGLVPFAAATLVLETTNTYFGLNNSGELYIALARIRMTVYIFCLVYWIVFLWRNASPPRKMGLKLNQQVSAINQALSAKLDDFYPKGEA